MSTVNPVTYWKSRSILFISNPVIILRITLINIIIIIILINSSIILPVKLKIILKIKVIVIAKKQKINYLRDIKFPLKD